MGSLFEIVQSLCDAELYSSVVYLGNLLLSANTKLDRENEATEKNSSLLILIADSLYQLEQYHRAENIYRKAIAARGKSTIKDSKKSTDSMRCEADLYFKLSKCLRKMGKPLEALGVLETIPAHSRSSKVKVSLWKLYSDLGRNDHANQSLKEAWTSAPCALDLLAPLLRNKQIQQTTATNKINQQGGSALCQERWLCGWLTAQSSIGQRDYSTAVDVLDELCSTLNNNVDTLIQLATTYDAIGEKHKAISTLQRARNIDVTNTEGMDKLAALLCMEKRAKELETLATSLMTHHTDCPQPWIAFAYLCKIQKKYDKALYFAHKAVTIASNKGGEALLVKARILMDMNKRKDALEHLNEARYQNGPLDIYETAVHCHIDMGDTPQALAWAQQACKVHPCPRADTTHAFALMKQNKRESQAKARTLLERAVEKAPYLLNAVLQLAENYDQTGEHDKAVNLLRAHTLTNPDPRLHRMLGDFLSKSCPDMALHSYRYCLTVDPNDTAAANSMHDIDAFETSLNTPPCLTPVAAAFTEMIHQSRDIHQQTDTPPANDGPDAVMNDTF